MKNILVKNNKYYKTLTALIPVLIIFFSCYAQKDNAVLIADIENQLLNRKTTVSNILTNKEYEKLHSETLFRELIKKYPQTGMIAITTDSEPGKKIKVNVTLKNKNGGVLPGVLVYLYHTDTRGWYSADAPHVLMMEGDRKHARLFGYVKTDKNGKFELHTIKPNGYPQSDLPAHIHIEINDGQNGSTITELLFDDDERLKGIVRTNAEREGFYIARPEMAKAPFTQQFSYTLNLK